MNFADVNAGVADLRHAVNTQVQKNAFKEIGTRGPAGTADEAGFLRLVAWSYAFLFERGRIVIPFLLQIPGKDPVTAESHNKTRKVVQTLRTWLFHTLDADSDQDLKTGRAASEWFLRRCQTTSPQKTADWNVAFDSLCQEITGLATYCTAMVSEIAGDSERAELQFGALRLRITREMQPFEYDQFVEDAATRLGEKINAKGFRERRLTDWRKFVTSLPDDADLKVEMQRIIDGEVFLHFRSRLPITSEELIHAFGLNSGKDVLFALEMSRHLNENGVISKESLLSELSGILTRAEE
jgi:hypothetical protein